MRSFGNSGCYQFGKVTEMQSAGKKSLSEYTSTHCGTGNGLTELRRKEQIARSGARRKTLQARSISGTMPSGVPASC